MRAFSDWCTVWLFGSLFATLVLLFLVTLEFVAVGVVTGIIGYGLAWIFGLEPLGVALRSAFVFGGLCSSYTLVAGGLKAFDSLCEAAAKIRMKRLEEKAEQ